LGSSNGGWPNQAVPGRIRGIVGRSIDAEQDVVGHSLADGDDDVIAEIGILAEANRASRDGAAVNLRPAR